MPTPSIDALPFSHPPLGMKVVHKATAGSEREAAEVGTSTGRSTGHVIVARKPLLRRDRTQLRKLIDSGTVRLLDLVFITKDEQDEIGVLEYEDHDDVALFAALDGDVGGFINDEDVVYAAAGLEPGSSAALLVWDDLWRRSWPRPYEPLAR